LALIGRSFSQQLAARMWIVVLDVPVYAHSGVRPFFVYNTAMEVGGYDTVTDWPKMGPSLLIATCLIVGIRTARWSATHDSTTSNIDLDREIEYAARVAHNVLSTVIKKCPSIFPQAKGRGTGQRRRIIRSERAKMPKREHPIFSGDFACLRAAPMGRIRSLSERTIPEPGINNLQTRHHLYVIDSSFAKIYLRQALRLSLISSSLISSKRERRVS
jgi:hypothetical protein